MFKYPKSFLFVMLLMVTCNVRAEFAPFSYMTSILSRVVYCCKPQTWGKFLWNRFGTVTRPELDVQVLATQKEINAIYAAGKQSFDKQFDQLKDELVEKLSVASKEFSGNLEKVGKHADENINIIQSNIIKLNGLIIAQQKVFEEQMEQQFKAFNEKLQLKDSETIGQFYTFKQSYTPRFKSIKVRTGNLEKEFESVKDIKGQTLQIIEDIQRPLTKEQRTMVKPMLDRPILEPSRPRGAAAALRLALPSNYH